MTYECVVVGAGAAGVTTSRALAEAGSTTSSWSGATSATPGRRNAGTPSAQHPRFDERRARRRRPARYSTRDETVARLRARRRPAGTHGHHGHGRAPRRRRAPRHDGGRGASRRGRWWSPAARRTWPGPGDGGQPRPPRDRDERRRLPQPGRPARGRRARRQGWTEWRTDSRGPRRRRANRLVVDEPDRAVPRAVPRPALLDWHVDAGFGRPRPTRCPTPPTNGRPRRSSTRTAVISGSRSSVGWG